MKLSTIAAAAAGGLPAARNAEAKPSSQFGSVLGDLATVGATGPGAPAPPTAGLRSGVAPTATPSSADPETGRSASGASQPDATDQDAAGGAPETTSKWAGARPALVEPAVIATSAADVLELAARAADPIRRAAPSTAAASAGSGVSVVPGTSADDPAESASPLAVPLSADHRPRHPRSANADRDPPIAVAGCSDVLSAPGTTGLVAEAAVLAQLGPQGSTASADAGTPAAASPEPKVSDVALPPSGVPTLVSPRLFPATSGPQEAQVLATMTPSPEASKVMAAALPSASDPFVNAPTWAPALPGSAERTTAAKAGQSGSELPAFADVASIIVQIEPGTVKVESHLGFAAAPVSTASGSSRSASPPIANDLGSSLDIPRGLLAAEPLERSTASDATAAHLLEGEEQPALAVVPPAATRKVPGTAASIADAGTTAPSSDAAPADHAILVLSTLALAPGDTAKPGTEASEPEAHQPTAAGDMTFAAATITATAPVASFAAQTVPPLTQQVADGISGLAAAAVLDTNARAPQVAPARTMVLQLSPAGLGTLSVRLHVAGRALDVSLEASDGRTTALIDRDRGALVDALQGKDYQLQTLTVTTQDTSTMPGGTHAERGTDSGSSRSPDPYREDGSRGGQGRRDEPGRGNRAQSRPREDTGVDRAGASLFV